jgi:hypothetical protein
MMVAARIHLSRARDMAGAAAGSAGSMAGPFMTPATLTAESPRR